LDREIPLALERLKETETLLSESAEKILSVAEELQEGFQELKNGIISAVGENPEGAAFLESVTAFGETLAARMTTLFEASSFDDLGGQRLKRAGSALESVASLLEKIRDYEPANRGYEKRPSPGGKPFSKEGRSGPPKEAKNAFLKGKAKKTRGKEVAPPSRDKSALKEVDLEKDKFKGGKKAKITKKERKLFKDDPLKGPSTVGGLSQADIEKIFLEEEARETGNGAKISDAPKTDAPKADAPKADAPNPDEGKTEE
jgi:hypothetical protein